MKSEIAEFEPLELERAQELEEIINEAGAGKQAVVIEPEDRGITRVTRSELISPDSKTNALVRYRRHY